jgi:hypothetical protein
MMQSDPVLADHSPQGSEPGPMSQGSRQIEAFNAPSERGVAACMLRGRNMGVLGRRNHGCRTRPPA